ncbi:four helix bundle protein [Candidatus Kuenenia sp.]|uniref:four helix bundle protein n=1 Tax=Candidatus Kuenenia sp. TaxID=2499824 RepID=UPI0032200A78
MKDFRELVVWQKAINLFEAVVKDTEMFPNTESARIIQNQVIRSISSISANIAEGFGRRRGKEYEHYLYISRGSANESIDWYEKLKRLNYVSADTFIERETICEEIRAMLTGMINKLESKN